MFEFNLLWRYQPVNGSRQLAAAVIPYLFPARIPGEMLLLSKAG
jgi:hypothetical protein